MVPSSVCSREDAEAFGSMVRVAVAFAAIVVTAPGAAAQDR
jgi:hypothetical protein